MVEGLVQNRRDVVQRDRARFTPDPTHVLVTHADLKALGIPYTLDHCRRLWKQRRFPAPLQISEHRIAWRLSDLQKWLASLQPVETAPGATSPTKTGPSKPAPTAPAKPRRQAGARRRR